MAWIALGLGSPAALGPHAGQALQDPSQQQAPAAPAQSPPKEVGRLSRCPQTGGQGIEQALGQGQALLTAPFARLIKGPRWMGPLARTRQGQQRLQMVEEPGGGAASTRCPAVHGARMA